jgi:EAL domain-containing protein (putative c-di-GMP-specific phosphodiesterase class I)
MIVQLIYCSAAKKIFDPEELTHLLHAARENNARENITGMLLYAAGSFFQVLEGEEEKIDRLFSTIERDVRHQNITIIIREPIAARAFADWTMGYADITPAEVDTILGEGDLFVVERSFAALGPGRANKLIVAFTGGRWRARISDSATPSQTFTHPALTAVGVTTFSPAAADPPPENQIYSFAFQPIINATTKEIFSYEALLRGRNRDSAQQVLGSVQSSEINRLDDESRRQAFHLAAHLGLATHLNLNVIPSTAIKYPTTIPAILEAAEGFEILPEQIVLEILESEMIGNFKAFMDAIHPFRGSGLLFAIDDFGAGYAGLNLLADFQPDLIKLDLHLVREVNRKGPRQAIIRGILHTCFDLGIDVIAEGVEAEEEYFWLRDAGIDLFQGYLFARPRFEELSTDFYLPE